MNDVEGRIFLGGKHQSVADDILAGQACADAENYVAGRDAIGTRVREVAGVLRVWTVMMLMVHVGSSSAATAT
ncbi:hypothetical protein GCM10020255_086710 [Rhodococcus baikonurensis]